MAVAGLHNVSPHLGEMERERVRQVFRQWKNFAAKERPEGWIGETEQKESLRGASATEIVDRIENGLTENTRRRSFHRLCGRKVLLDMLKKAEIEKQQELQSLLDLQAVSQFSHRILLQELIRERSLRNDRNITEGFVSRLDDISGQVSSTSSESDESSNTDIDGNGREQNQASDSKQDVNEFQAEIEPNVDEGDNHLLPEQQKNEVLEIGLSNHDEINSNDKQDDEINAVPSLLEDHFDREADPVGRMDPFYVPHEENGSRRELSELRSRRSVSTLLGSDFRQSLDQLLRSYLERQIQSLQDSDLEGTSPDPDSAEDDLENQNLDQNDHQEDSVQIPPQALPSPSGSSAQQTWDQESEYFASPQQDSDVPPRLGIELKMINELRIDMVKLQRRMMDMQRMLEACMDMQLELQRSIREEVSAALNRSDGSPCSCENGLPEVRSKLDNVRKGICCICCHTNIDSLLYRCGHMCTCLKCANELVQNVEKCPMCQAPVIEVICAYSTL